ncbi:MAG: hypothetical protein QME76_04390 [Bacillota bacterium]|nr:hypothetical protein [Bacillota bacterium]
MSVNDKMGSKYERLLNFEEKSATEPITLMALQIALMENLFVTENDGILLGKSAGFKWPLTHVLMEIFMASSVRGKLRYYTIPTIVIQWKDGNGMHSETHRFKGLKKYRTKLPPEQRRQA